MAGIDEGLEALQELRNVMCVETGGRFVENKQRMTFRRKPKIRRQFHALRLAARESCGRLSQPHIAKADVVQHRELVHNPFALQRSPEKLDCFSHRHGENVVDIFPVIPDVEGFFLIALSFAGFAGQIEICHELHFNLLKPIPFTRITAAARDVERKIAGFEAANACRLRGSKQLANLIEHLDVGNWIRTGRPSDR